jgi:hypothetical protein
MLVEMKVSQIIRVMLGMLVSICAAASQNSPKPTVEQILHNRAIWGKDFSVVLSQVPSWHSIGEDQVEVLSSRVIGTKAYVGSDSRTVKSRLNEDLQSRQLHALTAVDQWLSNSLTYSKADLVKMEKVMERPSAHPEDGVRVEVTSSDRTPQFLNPELTEADLNRELGAPDNVSYKKLGPSNMGGRPEIIKVYSYAGGAVQFEVSNLSPYPPAKDGRLVQKAIIDTSHVEGILPTAAK